MNWAGIFGLSLLSIIIVAITSIGAAAEAASQKVHVDPLLTANSLFCFLFTPWAVFGPVFPFVRMLYLRKKEYILYLRRRLTMNTLENSPYPEIPNPILEDWEHVRDGRPYIIGKKYIFSMILYFMIFQIKLTSVPKLLLSLARFNLSF